MTITATILTPEQIDLLKRFDERAKRPRDPLRSACAVIWITAGLNAAIADLHERQAA